MTAPNPLNEQSPDKKKLLTDVILLFGNSLIGNFFGFLRALIIPKLFLPADYGLWRLFGMILGYSVHLQCGTYRAMTREVPILLAEDKHEEIGKVRQSALWFSLSLGGVVGLGCILYALIGPLPGGLTARVALMICGVVVVLEQLASYHQYNLRALADFATYTRRGVLGQIANFALVVVLAPFLGLIGLACGAVGSQAIGAFFLTRQSPAARPGLDFAILKRLLKIGLPLFLSPLLLLSLTSLCQVLIAWKLGLAANGYYGFGDALSQIVNTLPNNLAFALYPRMLGEFGKSKEPARVGRYITRASPLMALFMPLLLGVAMICLEPFITLWIPKYSPALPTVMILLAGAVFASQASLAVLVLSTLGKFWHTPAVQIIFLIINLGGSYVMLEMGGGIEAVAVVIALSNIIYSLAMLLAAAYYSEMGKKAIFSLALRSLFPALWAAIGFVLIELVLHKGGDPATIGTAAAMLLLFLLWTYPITKRLFAIAKEEGLIDLLLKRKS
jgi:O-antigen/teichoic acid export membrane protein